jgi:MOSC domain-containing protein YiiM
VDGDVLGDGDSAAGGRVVSVNVGRRVPRRRANLPSTAIDKQPVDRVEVRDPGPKRGGLGSGAVGDEIGDPRHHGGRLQAVYAYATEDQQWWAQQIGRPVSPGGFGENVTTEGVELTRALVGEVWTIGDAVLRVEVPRIPCATFAEHMGVPRWVRRFTDAGRTGAYLSVVVPGAVEAGMAVQVERPDHDIDLLTLFRAFSGDLDLMRHVVEARVIDAEVQRDLERMLARRGG